MRETLEQLAYALREGKRPEAQAVIRENYNAAKLDTQEHWIWLAFTRLMQSSSQHWRQEALAMVEALLASQAPGEQEPSDKLTVWVHLTTDLFFTAEVTQRGYKDLVDYTELQNHSLLLRFDEVKTINWGDAFPKLAIQSKHIVGFAIVTGVPE